jgi:hypothetical protein
MRGVDEGTKTVSKYKTNHPCPLLNQGGGRGGKKLVWEIECRKRFIT